MLSYVMINDDGLLQALIFITIILLAMMGNLLVIVSVLRTNNLRRQKAYYFVVSLAVAGIIGLIEKLESANLIFQTCWYLSVPWYSMPSPWFSMVSGYSQCGCVICTMPWMLFSPRPPSSTFSASLCTGWSPSPEQIREEIDPINSSWLETNGANLESQMGSLMGSTFFLIKRDDIFARPKWFCISGGVRLWHFQSLTESTSGGKNYRW